MLIGYDQSGKKSTFKSGITRGIHFSIFVRFVVLVAIGRLLGQRRDLKKMRGATTRELSGSIGITVSIESFCIKFEEVRRQRN